MVVFVLDRDGLSAKIEPLFFEGEELVSFKETMLFGEFKIQFTLLESDALFVFSC